MAYKLAMIIESVPLQRACLPDLILSQGPPGVLYSIHSILSSVSVNFQAILGP